MKFRKKPVVIDAIQYTGDNPEQVAAFMCKGEILLQHPVSKGISINTLEGNMLASPGDWIIKGVAGEYYPCKPDIFETTYEAVKE